jgi:hypothetical protein
MATHKATKATKKPVIPEPAGAPPITGSQADYERFLPEALKIPAKEVIPFRADASLAYLNVSVGLDALLARESEARALPKTDVDALKLLPHMCLAVAFAGTQIADGASGEIGPKLARASVLRRRLFLAADALVDAGLLPSKPVEALHEGTGKIDMAGDCVGLAALFQQHAASLKGKTAVTAAELREAAELGTDLLARLKPRTARRGRSGDAKKAAEMRDRLWTLVKQGHGALWRACAYLYGPEEIEARVPALQAHAATTSKRKKANAAKKASSGEGKAPG